MLLSELSDLAAFHGVRFFYEMSPQAAPVRHRDEPENLDDGPEQSSEE